MRIDFPVNKTCDYEMPVEEEQEANEDGFFQ